MQRNDAVTAVTGEIFREGWSKVRGSMRGWAQSDHKWFVLPKVIVPMQMSDT